MSGTMKRRANGEGTIRLRADGRWEAQWIIPDTGRRKSVYGKTRAEAMSKLRAAQTDVARGLPVVEEKQTTAQYLRSWLVTVQPGLVPETWSRYRDCVELHLIPAFGGVPLAHLAPQRVQHCYARLLTEKKLSTTTVRHVHAVLHRALNAALRMGLVARNVADLIDKPKRRAVDIEPLTLEQAHAYLAAAEASGERLRAFFALALATGMRLGELQALTWRDVDLAPGPAIGSRRGAQAHVAGSVGIIGAASQSDKGLVRVMATLKLRDGVWVRTHPKTAGSRRQIAIDAPVVEALRAHRARQAAEKLAAGPVWRSGGVGLGELVFTTALGLPLAEGHIRWRHQQLLRLAGLPTTVRLHDLRHTYATLAIAGGVSAKMVSQTLGHASVAFTLQTYAHVLPVMQLDAAAIVGQLLWPASATGSE